MLHRPGAIEGHQGDDVSEVPRLHLPEQVLHALTLKLEHRRGIAAAQQLVGLRVVEGDVMHTELRPAVSDNEVEAVRDDIERLEAQKVHLDQAAGLDIMHLVLRGDGALPARAA